MAIIRLGDRERGWKGETKDRDNGEIKSREGRRD